MEKNERIIFVFDCTLYMIVKIIKLLKFYVITIIQDL